MKEVDELGAVTTDEEPDVREFSTDTRGGGNEEIDSLPVREPRQEDYRDCDLQQYAKNKRERTDICGLWIRRWLEPFRDEGVRNNIDAVAVGFPLVRARFLIEPTAKNGVFPSADY